MKILVVTAWDPVRLSDGASLVLFHHLRMLAGDHDLHVVTADREGPDAGASLPTDIVVERVKVRAPASVDAVARRVWALATGEPAHVRWVERRALVSRVRELSASWKPDVLWLFGWGTARLAHAFPGRVVHTVVDPWSVNQGVRDLRGPRRLMEAGERARVLRHERRHLPACDEVVVVAEPDARYLRESFGVHASVVPNGVDPGPVPVSAPAAPVIGFHGNLAATPNAVAAAWCVERLLPQLRAADPEVTLRLIGRDPRPELLETTIEGVVVTGSVPDVRVELDRLVVHVSPMSSGAGMKNKILEAMAAGRPVVTTPLGVQGIGEGAGIVVAELDDIPQAVQELLDDREAAAMAGAAGRARVERDFTWERSARAMERVLAGTSRA